MGQASHGEVHAGMHGGTGCGIIRGPETITEPCCAGMTCAGGAITNCGIVVGITHAEPLA